MIEADTNDTIYRRAEGIAAREAREAAEKADRSYGIHFWRTYWYTYDTAYRDAVIALRRTETGHSFPSL